MATKDTTVVSARVPDKTLEEINQRVAKKGTTLNKWINKAIKEALRKHRKDVW